MKVTRIFDLLDYYKANYPEKEDVLVSKADGIWKKHNINSFIEYSNYFSHGLMSFNFEKGERIVTISNNRPEWNFADMGMMQAGFIHVPVYSTISSSELEYIINHSSPCIILISGTEIYERYKSLLKKLGEKIQIFSFEKIDNINHWSKIIDIGKKQGKENISKLTLIKESIKPDDTATIIYTSGTTGNSKGVMLSHHNLLSNVKTSAKLIHIDKQHKILSFLPLCHVFERMTSYTYLYKGISIYYAENTNTIGENLKELKVDGFITVPRLLEKVYDRIIANGKALGLVKKVIFFWALRVGFRFRLNEKRNFYYQLKLNIANKLVFSKWREALGGNIKFIGVGGAALQKRLATIFWAANIPVYEGYGLTETSPIISVNWGPFPAKSYPNVKLGSVGPVFEEVEVKIAEDGEILCKGPNVTKGYYNDIESTQKVMDKEGWFHTGDIGTLDKDNFLAITDRKKEIFKTSGGKYIAPQVIENIFKESIYIEQIMVVGENKRFPAAIIVPNFIDIHAWATIKKIKFKNNEGLIENEKVLNLFQREVNFLNQRLGQTEKIKKFVLVSDEWTSETGELSPTLKLRRKILLKKYSKLLINIYS
ncbi:MAG: long-chain fatty acid--CoA ligase [Chlorobi bacterium]|nr:long-chain fatty acid--CoA ligase [Chlorobiota bacterium]